MGAVYIGAHALLGRTAAIKVLLPEFSQSRDIVQRFFNEARAASGIKHPGIVEIFDFGYGPDGSAYIVMELLGGESLADRLRRVGRLPAATAIHVARQTAAALGAAHRAGIVHRDLKPDNIFLVPDAETAIGERVKLLDFGIAKLNDGALARTRIGAVMGTPYYMAPEQCRGAADLDHRADLYALGCVLFEMLCGRPPFVSSSTAELLGAHQHVAPPPPRSIAPDVPAPVSDLVLRLLAKDPAQRPPTADAVAGELATLGGQLGLAMPSYAAMSGSLAAQGGVAPTTTLGNAAGALPTGAPTAAPGARSGARIALAASLGAIVVAGAVIAIVVAGGDRGGPRGVVPPPPAAADAGAPVAVEPGRDAEREREAAVHAAAVERAARERQYHVAQNALAKIAPESRYRAPSQQIVDRLRDDYLAERRLELAGLVDKRRCEKARELASDAHELWGPAADELTRTAAACRSGGSVAESTQADAGTPTPTTTTPPPKDKPAGSGRATIAKLLAVRTGLPECDEYLHTLGRYLSCDQIPESARNIEMDVDAVATAFRAVAAPGYPADARKSAADGCKQGTDGFRQAAAAMHCTLR